MDSPRRERDAGPRERRAFSAELKAQAVRLVAERRASGMSVAQVGRELDVRLREDGWMRHSNRISIHTC